MNIWVILCVMGTLFTPFFASTNTPHFRDRINTYPSDEWSVADIQAEIALGRKISARILGQYSLSNNQALQNYVNLIGQGIAGQLGRPEIMYYFSVIDSEHVNAYATPGGYIFITSGLLSKIKNESQLAGVLAHEISHVNRRYIVKKYSIRGAQSSLLSTATILASASTQTVRLTLNMIVDQVLDALLINGLDHEEEMSADVDAVNAMIMLDYNADDYIELLESIHAHSDNKSVSSTHPSLTQRLTKIEQNSEKKSLNGTNSHSERYKHYVNQ